MSKNWNDYNDADSMGYNLIPKNTVVKVCMKIKPGGYNNKESGWDGGYAKKSETTGAVYLDCIFTVMAGQYTGKKIFQLIGLYSEKNDNIWGQMGRAFIKTILNSKAGIAHSDESPAAVEARKITGLQDLDGIEFVAKISIQESLSYGDKNTIKQGVSIEDKNYAAIMSGVAPVKEEAAPQVWVQDDEIPF